MSPRMVRARPDAGRCLDRLAAVGRSRNGRASRERERVRRWLRPRGGRSVNYARRQQHRRLSHAARAALGSVGAALLGLVVASARAVVLGGLLFLTAVGLGLYARHWLSLARRSWVGARSEDEVQRALAALQGWCMSCASPRGWAETRVQAADREPGERSSAGPYPGDDDDHHLPDMQCAQPCRPDRAGSPAMPAVQVHAALGRRRGHRHVHRRDDRVGTGRC